MTLQGPDWFNLVIPIKSGPIIHWIDSVPFQKAMTGKKYGKNTNEPFTWFKLRSSPLNGFDRVKEKNETITTLYCTVTRIGKLTLRGKENNSRFFRDVPILWGKILGAGKRNEDRMHIEPPEDMPRDYCALYTPNKKYRAENFIQFVKYDWREKLDKRILNIADRM